MFSNVNVNDLNVTTPSDIVVDVKSNGGFTAGYPVMLYVTSAGVLSGITNAIVKMATYPDRWGVAVDTVADGETGKVKIFGLMTVASGGTANQLVTALSAAGVITDTAIAAGDVDDALGTSISATTFYKPRF